MSPTRRVYEYARKLIREKLADLTGNTSGAHECDPLGHCIACQLISEAREVLGEDALS